MLLAEHIARIDALLVINVAELIEIFGLEKVGWLVVLARILQVGGSEDLRGTHTIREDFRSLNSIPAWADSKPVGLPASILLLVSFVVLLLFFFCIS
jgi:hypothetical protein